MEVSTARPRRGRGGRGRGIYPTWASGVYLTGGGVYQTKVVSCYPFPIFIMTIMIYLEASHRDTRNEYNKDKEGKRQLTTRTFPYISTIALIPMWYSRDGIFS